MKQKIIVLGGIGNGTVISQAIQHSNIIGDSKLYVAGYFSDRIEPGKFIDGLPVLAKTSPDNIQIFAKKGYKFIYTILRIDGQKERIDLFQELNLTDDLLATFIHPSAYVAPNTTIEAGVVIMPNVMISSAAIVKRCSLIMTGVTIGHDTTIGELNHIASQAVIGAYIKTSRGVHVGLNSTIRENITIGENSTVGMGAVQTKNIGNNEIWAGNPSKFLRHTK
jgi:acetyltransferase EpsM